MVYLTIVLLIVLRFVYQGSKWVMVLVWILESRQMFIRFRLRPRLRAQHHLAIRDGTKLKFCLTYLASPHFKVNGQ